jgi:predicted ATP-dependent serine protease
MLTKIDDVNYDPDLFISHKTSTPLDQLFSVANGGGIPKATNWMIVGDPGVGKSTVTLDIISNAQKNGSKVLFISAEMNRIDLYLYVQRYPKFGRIPILFPQELEDDQNPKQAIENILNEGWDIVLTDSLIEVQEIVREHEKITGNAAEKWMLGQMYKHNLGNNAEGKFTTFLNIQQVNKGGVFVGSNKLKHMVSGMMHIKFVDEYDQDERYIIFSKNRRGNVGKQMFFDLSTTGNVVYDTNRFNKTEELRELKKKEKEKIKAENLDFNKLFGIQDTVLEEQPS